MKTVFIVDDNETNLAAARAALEGTYKTFTMPSAARMFQLLEKITPDLILLDVNMPVMNGFEALGLLKNKIATDEIPVIMLTARGDSDTVLSCISLGAVHYVVKPFDPAVLLSRIETIIGTADDMNKPDKTPEKAPDKTPEKAPQIAAPVISKLSKLPGDFFPKWHENYTLEIPLPHEGLIYEKNFTCPLCERDFKAFTVRSSRLKVISRSKDFRTSYEGIDTMHYEIITCTHCCFSMFDNLFKGTISSRFEKNIDKIKIYKSCLDLTPKKERDINGLFAVYYLALKCAGLFYASSEMNTAKIWLRLMWLYQDSGDEKMEVYALTQAHSAYLDVFEKTDVSPEAAQQMSVLLGELSLRISDFDTARTFFLKARTFRQGSQVLIAQAEDGIEEIRKRQKV